MRKTGRAVRIRRRAAQPRQSARSESTAGTKITLELRGNPLAPRYLNGNITRMTLSGREAGGNRYYIYRAVLRPTLWYLTQNRDFRIYRGKDRSRHPDSGAGAVSGENR